MVAYSNPDYPGATNQLDKLSASAETGDGTTVTTAVLSSDGGMTPVAAAAGFTMADADRFRMMQAGQLPSVPSVPSVPSSGSQSLPSVPTPGPASPVNAGGFQIVPFCCGGIGIKVLHAGSDMNFMAYAVIRLNSPSINFNLKIHGGQVQTAKVVLNGAAGLTVHIESATPEGADGNVNKSFFVPVDLSIPIGGMGVPFAVTLHQQLIIRTAFTAKNSTLSTTGDYSFTGQIYMGYDNGGWGVGAPTSLTTNQALGNSLAGVSLGATGMVFGMEGRIIVGIGAFGFVTGPYLGYSIIVGLTRGSDLVTGLVGITCRGTVLDLGLNVGVGYQIPQPVTKAINSILQALNLKPIQGSGGLKHNENLLHKAQDYPKNCAGYGGTTG
jgi:hypothetical protein